MTSKLKKERNYVVDIARAICIVLVVFYHYIPSNAPSWHLLVNDVLLPIRMPLFLFISGYIYMYYNKKKNDYWAFVGTKFKRLIIPYFVISTIIISIKLMTQSGGDVDAPVSLFSYVEMFYKPSAAFFLWFIWALFVIFLVVPFFKTRTSRVVLFLVTMIVSFLPVQAPEIFCLKQLKFYSMYFMAGVVWCDYCDMLVKLYKIPSWIVLLLFVMLQCVYLNVEEGVIYEVLFKLILPALGVAIVFYLSNWLNNCSTIKTALVDFSTKTYVIYMFHTIFMGFTKAIVRKVPFLVNPENEVGYTLGVIIVITSGVVCPVLLYGFIKKYRVTRFLFGLK